ncbi:hypothetical protein N658DRAFT_491643 [Parathielavia hyrcaniae]|uniref:Uncharacterized protein n=1 Tax=Parathielavia hyrcaniae TaxID=113614 RepID=A0AAN6Q7T0_9PEZI|nr:hypothetical protein N658DRAFT_491643 [Parathielavia hyrcaniae]
MDAATRISSEAGYVSYLAGVLYSTNVCDSLMTIGEMSRTDNDTLSLARQSINLAHRPSPAP